MAVDFSCDNGLIKVNETPVEPGEYSLSNLCKRCQDPLCNILVQPTMMELIKARCYYLAEKQQYHNSLSRLDGAYLIYDTEEGHIYYESKNDYNGGRERVGMGILMTKYLQQKEGCLFRGKPEKVYYLCGEGTFGERDRKGIQ